MSQQASMTLAGAGPPSNKVQQTKCQHILP